MPGSRVIRMPTGIDPSVFDVNQSIKNCSQGHVVPDFNGCFDKRLKATVNLHKHRRFVENPQSLEPRE